MMKRALLSTAITALACMLAGASVAQEQEPLTQVIESEDELSQNLNDLIDTAIDQGLLDKDKEPEVGPQETRTPAEIAQLAGAPQSACANNAPIAFSAVGRVRNYSDLLPFRALLGNATRENAAKLTLTYIEALISLGLYDEARIELAGLPDKYANFYDDITSLLRLRTGEGISFLDDEAVCFNRSLWQGIAMLAQSDLTGAQMFSDQISAFRTLAYEMRLAVLAIIVPKLAGTEWQLLAEQALATFPPEDFDQSRDLQFLRHLVTYGRSGEIDGYAIRTYLRDPSFRSEALETLVKVKKDGKRLIDEVPLIQISGVIIGSEVPKDIELALNAILDRLVLHGEHAEIIELSQEPKLKADTWQSKMADRLGELITKDLKSARFDRMSLAFDTLLSEPNVLTAHSNPADLYEAAMERAEAEGYRSLAQTFRDMTEAANGIAEARNAFAARDHETVFKLANRYSNTPEIALLAAKAAIRSNDKDRLKQFEGRVDQTAGPLLALLESDTVAQTWFVSDTIWQAADKIDDPEFAAKLTRLRQIRLADQRASRAAQSVNLNKTAALLAGSRDWLARRAEGGS